MPIALITGAGRGIGAAIADRFATAGWDLVLVDACRDDPAVAYSLATREDLDSVAERTGAVAFVGDVRSVDDLEAAVASLPQLDAAIAAAGVLVGGAPLWESDPDALRVQMDVNVGGVANLARVAVPRLLARPAPRRGRFVALGSATASKATPQLAGYAASKAGVATLVRSLAAELAGTGVTANVVEPGTTDTALLAPSQAVYGLSNAEGLVANQIDTRVLDPDEIAAGVEWLCSEDAGAVTGAVMPVDAGFSAR